MERKWYEVKSTACPNCGKKADDYDDVEREFGYRDMGDGRVRVQSWCKECR